MKKNKRGFTLVELLAVIVILMAISAIAIPSITASIERSKNKQFEAKKAVIIEAARLYYSEHKVSLTKFTATPPGNCYISVTKLGLSDKELENPRGGTISGGVVYAGGNFEFSENFPDIEACD